MAKVLVVEDDKNANRLICSVLRKDGHETTSAADGREALDAMDTALFDLVVTDLMMPRINGMELTRQLREAGYDIPILMLTARQEAEVLHRGFVVGADDYLTKPTDLKELVLRVRALLRRSGANESNLLTVGKVTLDKTRLTVVYDGKKKTLPPKEFWLLFELLSHPGRVYTRMQLLDEVWGWDTESAEATVNVHINRLRSRFADCGDFTLETVRGIGYCAEVTADE